MIYNNIQCKADCMQRDESYVDAKGTLRRLTS